MKANETPDDEEDEPYQRYVACEVGGNTMIYDLNNPRAWISADENLAINVGEL